MRVCARGSNDRRDVTFAGNTRVVDLFGYVDALGCTDVSSWLMQIKGRLESIHLENKNATLYRIYFVITS